MKDIVNTIDWAKCRRCDNNDYDGCVYYAYHAAQNGEIGCEYLELSDE